MDDLSEKIDDYRMAVLMMRDPELTLAEARDMIEATRREETDADPVQKGS